MPSLVVQSEEDEHAKDRQVRTARLAEMIRMGLAGMLKKKIPIKLCPGPKSMESFEPVAISMPIAKI